MAIPKEQVVLAHSGLAAAAPKINPGLVLVTGRCRTDAAEIVKGYGFENVRTVAEYARAHPHLHPLKHDAGTGGGGGNGGGNGNENGNGKEDGEGEGNGEEEAWASEPVRAIFVVETPEDWHEDLQILLDVLRSDGRPGGGSSRAPGSSEKDGKSKERQPVSLFCCNFDFYFAAANAPPRFGPGAFLAALEALHAAADTAAGISPHVPLEIERHGKPHPPAYEIAARKLERLVAASSSSPSSPPVAALKHIYALGDNPASDVRGANAAGGPWRSVLVRTGVWKGSAENDERDPAHFVCEDAAEAVAMILNRSGGPLS